MSGVIGASVRRSVAVSMLLLSFLAIGLVVSVGVAAAAPNPPTMLATSPVTSMTSPSKVNPVVTGIADVGSVVQLYTDGSCMNSIGDSIEAELFDDPGLTVTVSQGATTFYAAATDAGTTTCSTESVTYYHDSVPPAAPAVNGSNPVSPSNINTPKIQGNAESGSSVTLYLSPSCTGAVVGSGSAFDFASLGLSLTLPVAENFVTDFYATATDVAGNPSPCSGAFAYDEDSTPPALPTFIHLDSASPANNNTPRIAGVADTGSTVNLYADASCVTSIAGALAAATFASPGFSVIVDDNSRTTFYARATDLATNLSPCAMGPTYEEDSLPPSTPSPLVSVPASPANNNAPRVRVTATEPGSTVRLHTTADCSGTPAAEGAAADAANLGLPVAVPDDATTVLRTTARDTAGNVSGCSAPISYVEDSTPPDLPTLIVSVPGSPTNDNAPRIRGSAEPGSTVKLFVTAGCAGPPSATGSAADFASPGLAVSVADNTTTSFQATATDAAGNISVCSSSTLAYVESSPPQVKTTMALKNAGGSTYIALPTKPRKMTATFSVTEVSPSSYRGPIKLVLHIEGLKLDKVPPGVELSDDEKTAVWTIAAAQSATPLTLSGRTRVKRRAKFGVEAQGAGVVATPPPVTIERAKGTVTLKAAGTGRRTLRTLTGTVAASTCDREGTGKLSLRTELSDRGSGYRRVAGKPPAVHLDKPSRQSKVCTFRVSTGLPPTLPRSLRFRFQVVSSYGGKSGKVRFRAR